MTYVDNDGQQTHSDADADQVFRRLTEIRSALDSMPDEITDERLALETERARLRRRRDALAGGKDTHRSVESLYAELGERRRFMLKLHDLKIHNTGLTDGAWRKYGNRARTRASFEELNESIENAVEAENVRGRITEILKELRRRGVPTE